MAAKSDRAENNRCHKNPQLDVENDIRRIYRSLDRSNCALEHFRNGPFSHFSAFMLEEFMSIREWRTGA